MEEKHTGNVLRACLQIPNERLILEASISLPLKPLKGPLPGILRMAREPLVKGTQELWHRQGT